MEYTPIIVALIAAIVALVGYIHEKNKDREAELRKTRQDIHRRLIGNAAKVQKLISHVLKDKSAPDLRKDMLGWYAYVQKHHVDLWDAIFERIEIQSFLSVYGTDKSIKAVAKFNEASIALASGTSSEQPNLPEMILELRKSLFENTAVNERDIFMMQQI